MKTKIFRLYLLSCILATFFGYSSVSRADTDYPCAITKISVVQAPGQKGYLFALGEDGNVYLRNQNSVSKYSTSWSTTNVNLGNPGGPRITDWITAGRNSDGKVWLFAATNQGIYRIYYRKEISAGSRSFTSWRYLPLPDAGYFKIDVANGKDGELVLFYRHRVGGLYAAYFSTSGVYTYGQIAGYLLNNFTVATNPDGRLEIFTPGSDALYHIYQNSPGTWTWNNAWVQLGNPPNYPIDTDADVAWTMNQLGGLEVFIINTDNEIENCRQDPNGPGGWSSFWNQVTLIAGGEKAYKRMTAAKRYDGGLDIAYVTPPAGFNNLGMVNHIYQPVGQADWEDGGNIGALGSIFVRGEYIDDVNLVFSKVQYYASDPAYFRQRFFVPYNYTSDDIRIGYVYEDGTNSADGGWSRVSLLGW